MKEDVRDVMLAEANECNAEKHVGIYQKIWHGVKFNCMVQSGVELRNSVAYSSDRSVGSTSRHIIHWSLFATQKSSINFNEKAFSCDFLNAFLCASSFSSTWNQASERASEERWGTSFLLRWTLVIVMLGRGGEDFLKLRRSKTEKGLSRCFSSEMKIFRTPDEL